MKQKTAVLMVIGSLAAPALAQSQKEPLTLKPTSSWHVDYAEDRCRLARQFGVGDELIYLFMDRYGPTDSFRITVAGKPVRTGANNADTTIQFGPAEEEQQLLFLNGNLGKMPALVFAGGGARIAAPTAAERQIRNSDESTEDWPDLKPISEDRQKAVRYLKIGKPLRRSVILETGSMRAPLAALDKCIANLLTQWGIDIEKHKQLTRTVKPVESPGRWVKSDDYPLDMLSAGQPAIVEFRLSIDAGGKPTACHIQSTTRPKAFDDAVCKSVMRRARFEPALDAAGKPLASYYRNTVRFQIPD